MYRIEIAHQALKDLMKIPRSWQERIRNEIKRLGTEPRKRSHVKKLKGGPKNRYRLRVGDYRIVFDIEDVVKIILVVRIGHRKEIYRRFV